VKMLQIWWCFGLPGVVLSVGWLLPAVNHRS
jgi:hypothetical protein